MAIVVIGVGNADRGDDAVGLVVAQRLQAELGAEPTVRILAQQGDGTRLMAAWQGADAAFVIDAVQSGAPAGTVHRLEAVERPLPEPFLRCSTHAVGVAEGIELARVLRQMPSRLVVYGIEGRTFDIGAGLSAEVARAIPDLLRRLRQELQTLQGSPGQDVVCTKHP